MNILHITPYYYPATKFGGPIHSVHLLNKYLVKNGVNVDVYTTNAGLKDNLDLTANKWTVIDSVKVKYFNIIGYEHYSFSPQMFFQLLRSSKNYDLIHINFVWNFTTLAASLAGILCNKPYIITPRGTLNKEAINIKSSFMKRINYNLFAKHCLNKANSIHFTTEDEKDNVMSSLKLNCSSFIVPNGIEIEAYKNLPPKNSFKDKYPQLKNKRYILFLGRINFKKGLDLIARSFVELNKIYNDLFLVVVGPDNDNYKKELEKILSYENTRKKVIFTGILEEREKLEAYVDAEIFLLPSYSENFGMSVIEAMACGVPVIISNKVGIYRELQESGSAIIIGNKVEQLTSSISMLLENHEMRINLANKGKKFTTQNYDISKIIHSLIINYKEYIK